MFDFDAAVRAPFRMQPGLRRLAANATQLTPLAPGSRHQREKLAVLSAGAAHALLARPGFDVMPALHALCRHAAAEQPQAWAWDGRRAEARLLGVALCGDEVEATAPGRFGVGDELPRCLRALAPPWRLAGLLSLTFAEDLALVDASDGTIPWLAVALPSHWAPETKVGRHFAEVHAPVADNTLIVKATDALLALVTGTERWERFVWTITDQPRLHAHPRHDRGPRWRDTAVGAAWFRSERQTFLPLAEARQAWFTIAVDVVPLAQVAADPARARALHDALASMSDAVLAYRGLAPVREPLLAWLAART